MLSCFFISGRRKNGPEAFGRLMSSQTNRGDMRLSDVKTGEAVRVVDVSGEPRIAHRLMEMGIVPGVTLTVVKSAPFGDPIQIRLLGYSLALRRSEGAGITVETDGGRED